MPRAAAGAPALPDGFTYRFRVVGQSQPIRAETVGPFEIGTSVTDFYNVSNSDRFAARSVFTIHHRGQPVEGLARAYSVAVLGGERTALLVSPDEPIRCVFRRR